jgi:hypothetical protein
LRPKDGLQVEWKERFRSGKEIWEGKVVQAHGSRLVVDYGANGRHPFPPNLDMYSVTRLSLNIAPRARDDGWVRRLRRDGALGSFIRFTFAKGGQNLTWHGRIAQRHPDGTCHVQWQEYPKRSLFFPPPPHITDVEPVSLYIERRCPTPKLRTPTAVGECRTRRLVANVRPAPVHRRKETTKA